MAAPPESKFPNRLAYVLKLRGDATPDAIAGASRTWSPASASSSAPVASCSTPSPARSMRALGRRGRLTTGAPNHRSTFTERPHDTKQDAVRIGGWTRTLEELDRELGRLALAVQGADPRARRHRPRPARRPPGVRSGQPGRVRQAARTADDALRDPQKWAAEIGEPQVVAIENYVIERLRKSLPELTEPWTPDHQRDLGLVGTLVGGSATVATAWVTQRTLNKRELIRIEMSKRETLYGEFIGECSRLLVDALTHTLEKPETLLPGYALLNRIRLCASPAVLAEGERLLRRITDQYFSQQPDHRQRAQHRAFRRCRPVARLRRGVPRRAQVDARTRLITAHRTVTEGRRFTDDFADLRALTCLHIDPTTRATNAAVRTPHRDVPPAMRDRRPSAARLLAVASRPRSAHGWPAAARPCCIRRWTCRALCRHRPSAGRARSRLVGSLRRPGPLGPHSPRGNQNRDVRIAAQRVQAARAGVTISRSFWCRASASARARRRQPGFGTAPQQALPDLKTRSAGVEVSWEIDLSGRLRAGARAAAADAWRPRTASARCGCWS
jgi:hypothetical protein